MPTGHKPDNKAVHLARYVHELLCPQMTILFGSRARGNHRLESDVDILVVSEHATTAEQQENIRQKANNLYNVSTQVQLVHRTVQDFLDQSTNRNNLVARATDEGVPFTSDPTLTAHLAVPRLYDPDGDQETAQVHTQSWALRISSGVSKGIYKPVVQSDREFLRIGVGDGQ